MFSQDVDTASIPYLQKEREEARLRKLAKLRAEKLSKENDGDGDGDDDGEDSLDSAAGASIQSQANNVQQCTPLPGQHFDEKRQRKKKKSYSQKLAAEWDEFAAEEALFKKFKRGHISKEEYDEALLSANTPDVDDDGDDDSDDDSNGDGRKRNKSFFDDKGKRIDYRKKLNKYKQAKAVSVGGVVKKSGPTPSRRMVNAGITVGKGNVSKLLQKKKSKDQKLAKFKNGKR